MKATSYITALLLCACGFCVSVQAQQQATQVKPWNLSIYLDLSNRLIHGQGESQMLRDTAIISYLIDAYKNNVIKRRIVPCEDKFQVFFYPTTGIANASTISKALQLNLRDMNTTPALKKQKLQTMKQNFLGTIAPIYKNALQNEQWIGSDIWGFFKNKITYTCIEEGYRNILVILTDGYIYHKNSVQKQGNNAYSYILPQNIDVPNMQLLSCGADLQDLEVLVLEVNPTKFAHTAKMQQIIGEWLRSMGVTHYNIIDTDVTANVTPAIKQFLK